MVDDIESIKFRLMKLHQEKLEVALRDEDTLSLELQEIEDICEFMNTFLYD